MPHDIDIKKLRADLGMTQAELGEQVGVDQSTVSLWETTSTTPRGPARKLLAMLAVKVASKKRRRDQEVAA